MTTTTDLKKHTEWSSANPTRAKELLLERIKRGEVFICTKKDSTEPVLAKEEDVDLFHLNAWNASCLLACKGDLYYTKLQCESAVIGWYAFVERPVQSTATSTAKDLKRLGGGAYGDVNTIGDTSIVYKIYAACANECDECEKLNKRCKHKVPQPPEYEAHVLFSIQTTLKNLGFRVDPSSPRLGFVPTIACALAKDDRNNWYASMTMPRAQSTLFREAVDIRGAETATRIAYGVIKGLVMGWMARVIHGDLTPSNILLFGDWTEREEEDGSGRKKKTTVLSNISAAVCDWGNNDRSWVLRETNSRLTTEAYRPPEDEPNSLVAFGGWEKRLVYSFGASLLHSFDIRHRFDLDYPIHKQLYYSDKEGYNKETSNGAPHPLVIKDCRGDSRKLFTAEFAELLRRCLAYDPALRPTLLEVFRSKAFEKLRKEDESLRGTVLVDDTLSADAILASAAEKLPQQYPARETHEVLYSLFNQAMRMRGFNIRDERILSFIGTVAHVEVLMKALLGGRKYTMMDAMDVALSIYDYTHNVGYEEHMVLDCCLSAWDDGNKKARHIERSTKVMYSFPELFAAPNLMNVPRYHRTCAIPSSSSLLDKSRENMSIEQFLLVLETCVFTNPLYDRGIHSRSSINDAFSGWELRHQYMKQLVGLALSSGEMYRLHEITPRLKDACVADKRYATILSQAYYIFDFIPDLRDAEHYTKYVRESICIHAASICIAIASSKMYTSRKDFGQYHLDTLLVCIINFLLRPRDDIAEVYTQRLQSSNAISEAMKKSLSDFRSVLHEKLLVWKLPFVFIGDLLQLRNSKLAEKIEGAPVRKA